jgi:hypothetical protein
MARWINRKKEREKQTGYKYELGDIFCFKGSILNYELTNTCTNRRVDKEKYRQMDKVISKQIDVQTGKCTV